MLGKILSLFASVILLVGCSSNAPDIRAICLRDDIGNYVIKWETDPVMEGIVKMTVSDNPDLFTNESPIIYANIKDGVATYITNDNISRKYYKREDGEMGQGISLRRVKQLERMGLHPIG